MKKLPSWLKGGLTGVIIDVILIVFAFLFSSPADADTLALNLVQYPLTFFTGSIFNNNFILVVGGLIVYFIIGAIIGWIIRRLKNKK